MSKEYLEAFEILLQHIETEADWSDYEKVKNAHKIVEQALQRLEAIDNSNPSEALECLERVEAITKAYSIDLFSEFALDLDTIKQALLKAQEPKKYLKWEDLEFTNEEQSIQVLLNGKKYTMFYYDDDVSFDTVVIGGVFIDCCDKQLFNDLHLERVEE